MRLPVLKQVKIDEHEEGLVIDLDFETDYIKQAPIRFDKLN